MSNASVIKKKLFNVEPVELRKFLQGLHANILEDVDSKLQKGVERIVLELQLKHKPQNGFIEKSSRSKKAESPEDLPPKEFVIRNSALTNLWENVDMSSIYNGCVAVCVLIHIYIVILYCFNIPRFKRDSAMLFWAFSQFHIVMDIWIAMNLSIIFLMHPTFKFWAISRPLVRNKRLYDALFCSLFVLFEAALLTIPAVVIIMYNVPPISSFIALAETARLFMKSYAFVRENIGRAFKYKPHQDGDKEDSYPCPNMKKLVYFLFAPTLIYRDNYPRTSHIRWSFVAWNCLQMIGCLSCTFFIYNYFVLGILRNVGVQPIPIVHFIAILGMSVIVGVPLVFIACYSIFHCWQNGFAELLRFGDRKFYNDWWNATTFPNFLRSWNRLVHDWAFYYVYKDLYLLLGRSRTGAMLIILLISAIIHEYILSICIKFLFPLLFGLYSTFGILLVFVTRKQTSSFWNAFLWGSMFQGFGLHAILYTLEWYARINCPRIIDSWLDYVVPRSFYCNVISFSTQNNTWSWLPSDF